jgi:diacylglycerol kinase family enzyme
MRVDQGDDVQFGFTLATGYLHRFFETMHRTEGNSPGKVATLLASMFGAFFLGSSRIDEMFRCEPARICIGNQWLDWPDSNGIAAATMEQVGMGIRPFSRAAEAEGCFHAMVFRITPSRFARVAFSFARGRLGDHPQHVDRVTDRLVVEADTPIPYAFDGDLFRAGTRLEITSGPRLSLVRI